VKRQLRWVLLGLVVVALWPAGVSGHPAAFLVIVVLLVVVGAGALWELH
jgi:hypothetical protein